ncbi:MAG: fibronectin type III domain-containing protein [Actinomycetota bacterium]
MAFAAPVSNGGEAITAYTATCQSGDGGTTRTQSGGATPLVVGSLTVGKVYTCSVTATNAVGTGPASAASASFVAATVPGVPTGVSVVRGNLTAVVAFTAPANSGSAAVTGYSVSCPSSDGGTTRTASGSGSPISVTALSVGKTYACTVAAVNAIGTGTVSVASAPFTAATVPGAPTVGTATRGDASVAVAFTAPVSNGSATITGYSVACTSSDGGAAGTASGATSPISVTNLTIGKTYTCAVQAMNAIGTGPASASTTAFVFASVPGAPVGISILPANQSARISFLPAYTSAGVATASYAASCTSTNGGTAGSVSGATSPLTVTGLTNGKIYTCKVRGTNVIGTGAWSPNSASFVPLSVPGTPTAVTATRANSSASVAFTAPAATGGTPITGYSLTCSSANGGSTGYATGSVSPVVVRGLTNGKTYTCRVGATNAVGSGPQSTPSNSFVPATVPGAPTVTAVLKTASGQIRVSFAAPATTGGAPVSAYNAQCTSTNGGTSGSASGGTSPITVVGLTAGKSYTCKVRAVNIIGPGAWSPGSVVVSA